MSGQEQFLDVVDRDEAERRLHAELPWQPLAKEAIPVIHALGRILADDLVSKVDVPAFDRSNVDGYALRAVDTYRATESEPRTLRLRSESLDAGSEPKLTLLPGEAVSIATGGMVPRGADAIVMVEHADEKNGALWLRRAVAPGTGITYAGTDIARGETVLLSGTRLTSRETGLLAAVGEATVHVWRKPKVAIFSTGNEIVSPGSLLPPAKVYDSNGQILSDAVREQGGEPSFLGIVADDLQSLTERVEKALLDADIVLLSGGTSKGRGDLCYQVAAAWNDPGIIVHGVALKPGKPICMAVTRGKPVIILPGFPTSAIFTFHEFVAPLIRRFSGQPPAAREFVSASMAMRTNSEIGRTEYLLVGLVHDQRGLVAFPMGKGSGSVTTFSHADGFVTIPRHTEYLCGGDPVEVCLLGRELRPADLVVIGSHCVGLDKLLSTLHKQGISSKFLAVGSTAGLEAAQRGLCDLAGIHLLDPITNAYNRPFLDSTVEWVEGYRRSQGMIFRRGDRRFEGKSLDELREIVVNDQSIVMVNRNQGSGTRILIDQFLRGAKPPGYAVQTNHHRAVAAAVLQGRADWGIAIQAITADEPLSFQPIRDEHYDFVIPKSRINRPAVRSFLELLAATYSRSSLPKPNPSPER